MKVKHLAHLAFKVSDMEKALAFYCDGLGFQQAFTLNYDVLCEQLKEDLANGTAPEDLGAEELRFFETVKDKPWLVYLQIAERQFLELYYTYQNEPLCGDLSQKCGYQHFCLEVDDIEAAWQHAIGHGITPVSGVLSGPDRSRQFFVVDPDGNQVEIIQYTPESYQIVNAVREKMTESW